MNFYVLGWRAGGYEANIIVEGILRVVHLEELRVRQQSWAGLTAVGVCVFGRAYGMG